MSGYRRRPKRRAPDRLSTDTRERVPEAAPPSRQDIRTAAGDVDAWARTVLGRTLRPYQREVARAVADSIRYQRGHTITVMMARQMGKNETSAILESYLLALFRDVGGAIVKAAPTLRPQAVNSRRRLIRMLDNPLARGAWELEDSTMLRWGAAECHFFSASPAANIVGATADILLELDEAQDLTHEKIDRDLRPMVASTNATRVYYGTAWDADNPLETQKRHNLELEARDGIRRHFEYDWTALARLSDNYRKFVEGEFARLGPDHPSVQTQYLLKAIDDAGKLFPRAMREALLGDHPAELAGTDGSWYVCGIDVAGQDSALAIGLVAEPGQGGRDATVVTVGRVSHNEDHEPVLHVVAHFAWAGASHVTQHAMMAQLVAGTFECAKVVIDATGLGAAPAAFLARRVGISRVEPFVFTMPSKSRLGYNLLAFAGTGRLKLYAQPADEELQRHRARLLRELEAARYALKGMETLSFGVPSREGHDDYLMSLALCAYAAATTPPPPVSDVIPPEDRYRHQTPESGYPEQWDRVW